MCSVIMKNNATGARIYFHFWEAAVSKLSQNQGLHATTSRSWITISRGDCRLFIGLRVVRLYILGPMLAAEA